MLGSGLVLRIVLGCKVDKILLPSAVHLEERLKVSQSVTWSGKQSVRQSVGQAGRQTETHSLGCLGGRLGNKQ